MRAFTWIVNRPWAMILPVLAFAIGLAHGGPLLPCTATGLVAQEQQSNCVITNPGGSVVITASFTNDPTCGHPIKPERRSISDHAYRCSERRGNCF